VVYGAARIAERLDAKVVVIATRSGRTALVKSKQRDFISTISVSNQEKTLRRMSLLWGVEPLRGAPTGVPALRDFIDDWGRQHGTLSKGDLVVLLASGDFGTDAHNQVLVHEVS
jgi:pyruvate kinase